MKGQFEACKKIKCDHMGEDVEFMLLVMKMLASTAGIVLIAIVLINLLIK